MQLHKLIEELEKLEVELGEDTEVDIVIDGLPDAERFTLDEVDSFNGRKVMLIHRAL